jgi:hypothetical protein
MSGSWVLFEILEEGIEIEFRLELLDLCPGCFLGLANLTFLGPVAQFLAGEVEVQLGGLGAKRRKEGFGGNARSDDGIREGHGPADDEQAARDFETLPVNMLAQGFELVSELRFIRSICKGDLLPGWHKEVLKEVLKDGHPGLVLEVKGARLRERIFGTHSGGDHVAAFVGAGGGPESSGSRPLRGPGRNRQR